MHRFCAVVLVFSALAVLALSAGCVEETPAAEVSVGHEMPAVFSELSYEEAKAAAEADGKILIVNATARWCVPCGKMCRTTWVDEALVSWITEHAIAIQVDVDWQVKVARQLEVSPPIPIVAVYKDGEEFDRVVGYQSADELLQWLEGAL
jgi:thiol:disulfide interchange protein